MAHMVALAAGCAAAFAWLLFRPVPTSARIDRLIESPLSPSQGMPEWLVRALLSRLDAHRERVRSRQRWRGAVIELCDGMASELAAGRTPDEALAVTAALLPAPIATQLLGVSPELIGERPPGASRHSRQGAAGPISLDTIPAGMKPTTSPPPVGLSTSPAPRTSSPTMRTSSPATRASRALESPRTPAEQLEGLARQPGAEGLRLMAACWRIGAERGATLAAVLDDLAAALRDQEATRQELATQLAGPRATARLLAVLPLLGLITAGVLGADPVAFLFGTLPGLACLLAGIGLNATGVWWTHRLAKKAGEPV
jgi:tight adherence protein B